MFGTSTSALILRSTPRCPDGVALLPAPASLGEVLDHVEQCVACGQGGTPAEGRSPTHAAVWAADNGCYGHGYPGDTAWLRWLHRHRTHADRCLFATAPDVPGKADATLQRSMPHLTTIRALGYPAALIAQDGLERLPVPWPEFDVLFLGGTTPWKLGPAAAQLAADALRHGKPVHLGRVNSATRWHYARRLGCASVDVTFLAYAPDANLNRLRRWINASPPVGPTDRRWRLDAGPCMERRYDSTC